MGSISYGTMLAPLTPGRAGESGEIALTSKAYRLSHLAYPIAVLTLASLAPTPARADFFDDLRQTFDTDIPHFFQDDIPCAFGGQPTSHTKTSCKSTDHPAKPPGRPADHTTDQDHDRAAVPSHKPDEVGDTPPSSSR